MPPVEGHYSSSDYKTEGSVSAKNAKQQQQRCPLIEDAKANRMRGPMED
jgi:hypothetical protein